MTASHEWFNQWGTWRCMVCFPTLTAAQADHGLWSPKLVLEHVLVAHAAQVTWAWLSREFGYMSADLEFYVHHYGPIPGGSIVPPVSAPRRSAPPDGTSNLLSKRRRLEILP